MPITLHCDPLPLTQGEVESLWQTTLSYRQFPDEAVAVACVGEEEIQALNLRYRKKDNPTNVLTFSYDKEHDVILCMGVAEREAHERSVPVKEYVALLLVHAFLHVTGLDHEESAAAARETEEAERLILAQAGFTAHNL